MHRFAGAVRRRIRAGSDRTGSRSRPHPPHELGDALAHARLRSAPIPKALHPLGNGVARCACAGRAPPSDLGRRSGCGVDTPFRASRPTGSSSLVGAVEGAPDAARAAPRGAGSSDRRWSCRNPTRRRGRPVFPDSMREIDAVDGADVTSARGWRKSPPPHRKPGAQVAPLRRSVSCVVAHPVAPPRRQRRGSAPTPRSAELIRRLGLLRLRQRLEHAHTAVLAKRHPAGHVVGATGTTPSGSRTGSAPRSDARRASRAAGPAVYGMVRERTGCPRRERPDSTMLAGVHHRDAVCDLVHDAEVVGDEKHRQCSSSSRSARSRFEDLRLDRDVQRGSGLVGDEELRGRAASAMAIITRCFMPAGELVRVGVEARVGVGDAEPGRRARGCRGAPLARDRRCRAAGSPRPPERRPRCTGFRLVIGSWKIIDIASRAPRASR